MSSDKIGAIAGPSNNEEIHHDPQPESTALNCDMNCLGFLKGSSKYNRICVMIRVGKPKVDIIFKVRTLINYLVQLYVLASYLLPVRLRSLSDGDLEIAETNDRGKSEMYS